MIRETAMAHESIHEAFSLEGKVALVTGAAGHLGRALAEALAGAGAWVFLAGRTAETLEQLAATLASRGHYVSALPFDVRSSDRVREAMKALGDEAGRLDVLVNNAHVPRSGAFLDACREDFVEATQLSVAAAHDLITAALPLLERAARDGSPSVVNVASMYGMVSPDPGNYSSEAQQNPPFYGAAKAALIQYTRQAATHLAPRGVRVNALSPGAFPTSGADPALLERLGARIPLGRVGVPEELATALLFLASPRSSFVTGVNLPVDGGYTAW
jgi:NAD(P)-dependent dehydrogenase (short-subunit alcohol dehydrogenase family)